MEVTPEIVRLVAKIKGAIGNEPIEFGIFQHGAQANEIVIGLWINYIPKLHGNRPVSTDEGFRRLIELTRVERRLIPGIIERAANKLGWELQTSDNMSPPGLFSYYMKKK